MKFGPAGFIIFGHRFLKCFPDTNRRFAITAEADCDSVEDARRREAVSERICLPVQVQAKGCTVLVSLLDRKAKLLGMDAPVKVEAPPVVAPQTEEQRTRDPRGSQDLV